MQSKMLNIPSYIDDPSYRYKMPSLQLKIEGRGNGIKTKIVNLTEVATHLRVPPGYPLKFLGYELGSQTNESQSVLNGAFTEPEMRKHLDKFIEKYVLCSNCKYPEMVMKIKHGNVGGTCNSCGTRSVLDNAHKLAAYIIKNPPKNASEFSGDKKAGEAKESKDKGEKKEDGKTGKEDGKKHGKHGEKGAHEAKPHEGKHAEKQETDKKEDERGDGKVKEIAAQQPTVTVTVTFKDLEEDLIAKVRQMYLQYSSVESFSDNPDAVNKIIGAAKEIVPEDHANKIPYVLFNAIFDLNIAKEVGKNQAIMAQAYTELSTWEPELDILLSLQKFLLVRNNSFVFEKYVPTILKFFYDEDLLTEEFLLDWEQGKLNSKLIMDFRYQKSVDEKFKAAALSILKWLRDEEDGEGEGEANGKEDEDSDIDIDNI